MNAGQASNSLEKRCTGTMQWFCFRMPLPGRERTSWRLWIVTREKFNKPERKIDEIKLITVLGFCFLAAQANAEITRELQDH